MKITTVSKSDWNISRKQANNYIPTRITTVHFKILEGHVEINIALEIARLRVRFCFKLLSCSIILK